MDDGATTHKKRRHENHYSSSDYHQKYKKHVGGQRDEWRSGSNIRDKDRFSERQDRGRTGNQYRDPSESLWDVELNLIGQMDPNPMIHVCDTCRLPIRSYGRLIPCKHVFCFKCAKKTDKNCPRCGDEVHRIEQCRHGTVWMCSVSNCSRTYLSQRDLQAHINHRHSKPPPPPTMPPLTVPPPHLPNAILVPPPPVSSIPPPQVAPPYVLMPQADTSQPPAILPPPTIPVSQDVMSARPSSNLITIQIQDDQQSLQTSAQQSARVDTTSSGHWPPHSTSRSQNRANY